MISKYVFVLNSSVGYGPALVYSQLIITSCSETGAWSLPAGDSLILGTVKVYIYESPQRKGMRPSRRWMEEEECCLLILLHLLFAAAGMIGILKLKSVFSQRN